MSDNVVAGGQTATPAYREYAAPNPDGSWPVYNRSDIGPDSQLLPLHVDPVLPPPAYEPPYPVASWADPSAIMANYFRQSDWDFLARELWPYAKGFLVQGYSVPDNVVQQAVNAWGQKAYFQGQLWLPKPFTPPKR
jgi:hypothetical protein